MYRFLTTIIFSICFSAISFYAHADENTSSNTTFMPNTNLQGNIYKQYSAKSSAFDPEVCQKRCIADKNCVAWTYRIKRHKKEQELCQLLKGPTKPVPDNCCTSGVKFTVKKLNIQNTVTSAPAKLKPFVPPVKVPKQVVKPKIPEPPQQK